MSAVDYIQATWPIFAAYSTVIVAGIWWAATKEAQIRQLQEQARNSANHSGEIMLIKQTLENLTEKVAELIEELRSTNHRVRK